MTAQKMKLFYQVEIESVGITNRHAKVNFWHTTQEMAECGALNFYGDYSIKFATCSKGPNDKEEDRALVLLRVGEGEIGESMTGGKFCGWFMTGAELSMGSSSTMQESAKALAKTLAKWSDITDKFNLGYRYEFDSLARLIAALGKMGATEIIEIRDEENRTRRIPGVLYSNQV